MYNSILHRKILSDVKIILKFFLPLLSFGIILKLMKNVRQTNINIHRDSWVEINLENISHNMRAIRKNTPKGIKLLAVVKADAYGHGSVMIAPTLLASGADMLGVASID